MRAVPRVILRLASLALPFASLALRFVALAAALAACLSPAEAARPARATLLPSVPPCEPATEVSLDTRRNGDPYMDLVLPDIGFCAQWNPEFGNNGHHCCGKTGRSSRAMRKVSCAKHRRSGGYCSEMTPEQREYVERARTGTSPDILELVTLEMGRRGGQSYCTVNNGFLAWGRPLVATGKNRIQLRNPDRCTNFGTDGMVGMLEWVGREIARKYSGPEHAGLRLTVGDISAPRGGCLSGRGGRRGHLSHTSGVDADIAFLLPRPGVDTALHFHRTFDAEANWWFLKQLFRNPFACVKVVFIDKSLIRKLSKAARGDEEWERLKRFVRHMPYHKNHFHVRVGDAPGQPGCKADSHPELEVEDMGEDLFPELDSTAGQALEVD